MMFGMFTESGKNKNTGKKSYPFLLSHIFDVLKYFLKNPLTIMQNNQYLSNLIIAYLPKQILPHYYNKQ